MFIKREKFYPYVYELQTKQMRSIRHTQKLWLTEMGQGNKVSSTHTQTHLQAYKYERLENLSQLSETTKRLQISIQKYQMTQLIFS